MPLCEPLVAELATGAPADLSRDECLGCLDRVARLRELTLGAHEFVVTEHRGEQRRNIPINESHTYILPLIECMYWVSAWVK